MIKLPTDIYLKTDKLISCVFVETANLFEKPMKKKDSEQKNHEDAARLSSSTSSSLIQCTVPFSAPLLQKPYCNILCCATADFTYTAKNTAEEKQSTENEIYLCKDLNLVD